MKAFALWDDYVDDYFEDDDEDDLAIGQTEHIADTIAADKITAAHIARNKTYSFDQQFYENWRIAEFELRRLP